MSTNDVQLCGELENLATNMRNLAYLMQQSENIEIQAHGRELNNAALTADGWVTGIMAENQQKEGE